MDSNFSYGRRLKFFLVGMIGISCLVGRATAESNNWLQWRGPTRDGHISTGNWPDSLSKSNIKKLWQVKLSEGYPGPIVSDDMVYVAETHKKSDEIVRAFDRKTGKQIWETSWKGAMDVPFFAAKNGSWIRSTPAFDGETLYVGGMLDNLCALDGKTGEIKWTVNFVERFNSEVPMFGFVCSPMLDGDALYTQSASSFVKLDKNTGKTIWRTLVGDDAESGAFSSPSIATIHGRKTLLVQTRESLTGVDPETGNVLWQHEVPSFRGMNILSPVSYNNSVFTSTYRNKSYLYQIQKNNNDFKVSKAWDNKANAYMSSPIIIDDYVYVHLQNRRMSCIDLKTGEEKWRSKKRFGDYCSMVANNNHILALNDEGELFLIHANPDKFDLVGSMKVSKQPTWGYLAIAGNEIFIRELKGLVAYKWSDLAVAKN